MKVKISAAHLMLNSKSLAEQSEQILLPGIDSFACSNSSIWVFVPTGRRSSTVNVPGKETPPASPANSAPEAFLAKPVILDFGLGMLRMYWG